MAGRGGSIIGTGMEEIGNAAKSAVRRGGVPDEARLVHRGVLAATAGKRRDRRTGVAARYGTAHAAQPRYLGAACADGRHVVAADPVEDPTELQRPELLDAAGG